MKTKRLLLAALFLVSLAPLAFVHYRQEVRPAHVQVIPVDRKLEAEEERLTSHEPPPRDGDPHHQEPSMFTVALSAAIVDNALKAGIIRGLPRKGCLAKLYVNEDSDLGVRENIFVARAHQESRHGAFEHEAVRQAFARHRHLYRAAYHAAFGSEDARKPQTVSWVKGRAGQRISVWEWEARSPEDFLPSSK